ncbi:MAG: hypothetical protein UDG94_11380, partial [Peptococcaceae bacterium]|nr:hypothetical protein [Peptococcaceae bacterium]
MMARPRPLSRPQKECMVMAVPPPLAGMIILYYTKEKNIWVSYFLGPKSMSAPQSRAQTGFARTGVSKIFSIFSAKSLPRLFHRIKIPAGAAASGENDQAPSARKRCRLASA